MNLKPIKITITITDKEFLENSQDYHPDIISMDFTDNPSSFLGDNINKLEYDIEVENPNYREE